MWERERERERERIEAVRGKTEKKKKSKEKKRILRRVWTKLFFFNIWAIVAMHCSCEAKKYDFGSTNVATFWYLMVLKIAI